jgi:hypothetical protein
MGIVFSAFFLTSFFFFFFKGFGGVCKPDMIFFFKSTENMPCEKKIFYYHGNNVK